MKNNSFIYLLLFLFTIISCKTKKVNYQNPTKMEKFDWEGHRGCRGLLPENSIEGFLNALSFPEVTTLEMDLAVSKDHQLVVSHEPWMSDEICSFDNGTPINYNHNVEKYISIYNTLYEDIKKFDCGSRGNPRFKNQILMKTYKPTLKEVISKVKLYCKTNNRILPKFNIEIKTKPEWDNIFTPDVSTFCDLILETIKKELPDDYSTIFIIQSFDIRALESIKKKDKLLKIAYLIENDHDFKRNMSELSFVPDIYSPNYSLVNAELINQCKTLNIKVIPWTVNTKNEMKHLIQLGVDGIITDYPNLINEVISINQ